MTHTPVYLRTSSHDMQKYILNPPWSNICIRAHIYKIKTTQYVRWTYSLNVIQITHGRNDLFLFQTNECPRLRKIDHVCGRPRRFAQRFRFSRRNSRCKLNSTVKRLNRTLADVSECIHILYYTYECIWKTFWNLHIQQGEQRRQNNASVSCLVVFCDRLLALQIHTHARWWWCW